ncbi:MAG: prolyl oligopeptidase family serine peptidase [Pirellula sp.]
MLRFQFPAIVWVLFPALYLACGLLDPHHGFTQDSARIPGWPAQVQRINYLSGADQSQQPSLFYDPGGSDAKPLLIALHTWSGNYTQSNSAYAVWCIEKRWVMMHPDFRGVNDRPEACGSEQAVQDIMSAVEHAKRVARIDENRIYLIGASGGGYASLLMAGRAPELWAGVSAWCPIYDLKTWHSENKARGLKYAQMLERVCGGAPGTDAKTDEQYLVRSASAWLMEANGVHLSINTGITDGHDGSVPVSHTLNAFNAVSQESEKIPDSLIARLVQEPRLPSDLKIPPNDPLFASKSVLFRRASRNAQVTLFQGGHEIIYLAGLAWLEQQRRDKPPVWEVAEPSSIDLSSFDTKSGK